ncbi:hypothetical protein [Carnobacterium jeotgali]|nr:hypothetical protein [Carnobacterium jeotgali]
MNFIVIFLLLAGAFLLLLSLTLSISQLKAELYQMKKNWIVSLHTLAYLA